ncbi:hypothetical protein [Aminobacter sp. DSM 101952]|uniref:hypothetical protein n=1 Tax=Aminobacter sp. DSM 101952 TaxID=2735891 RepID=UPI0012E3E352|nr:hypothetical protein [Aminobacter sp. DSM 101952]
MAQATAVELRKRLRSLDEFRAEDRLGKIHRRKPWKIVILVGLLLAMSFAAGYLA